jgi:GMC oxidoreductase
LYKYKGEPYEIRIEWEGPYSVEEVINKMVDGGENPDWDGNDYGLYQIYGRHILCGKNTLLYIGIAPEETFSQRFREHKIWLDNDQDEEDVNADGQVFNYPNLYAVDGSIAPSALGPNPSKPIGALAERIAKRIIKKEGYPVDR